MKKIIQVVAGCIIKQHPLRILLHQKDEAEDERGISRNPELVGKWEFPGGMMEYGESPEQALRREIGEELGGVIITIHKLIHVQSNIYKDRKHYLVLFYVCTTNYNPAPDGCKYIAAEQITEMDCLPGTPEVIRKIARDYK